MKTIMDFLTDADKLKRLNDERNELIARMNELAARVSDVHKEMVACFDIPEGTIMASHQVWHSANFRNNVSAMTTHSVPHMTYLWGSTPAIAVSGYLRKKDGSAGKRDGSAMVELETLFPGAAKAQTGA